jgi:PAS domain S-box-containing protein
MIADVDSILALEERVSQLENENRILREREFSVLKALPEIVFMLDVNESCVFLNTTCMEKFKLSENDLLQKVYLKDLLAPESLFYLRKLYIQNSDKDVLHAHDLTGRAMNGNCFPFTAYITKLYKNGRLKGFVGVGFDITEINNTEQKLKEANLAKMKFLSIIAHDLRNPFNSLVGFSTLLLSNFDSYSCEKVKEYIQHMSTAANQGYQLLENLLDWARANTKKIDFNPITINMHLAAQEALGYLNAAASKKEITIEQNIPDNIYAYADVNMIKTVIRNLISNAIKFTARKGTIKLKSYSDDSNTYFEVIDNGMGIRADKLKDLFSLSNEFKANGTEKEKGTGLGLILCYEFMSMNNGNIYAESIEGKGSIFKFHIPRVMK